MAVSWTRPCPPTQMVKRYMNLHRQNCPTSSGGGDCFPSARLLKSGMGAANTSSNHHSRRRNPTTLAVTVLMGAGCVVAEHTNGEHRGEHGAEGEGQEHAGIAEGG